MVRTVHHAVLKEEDIRRCEAGDVIEERDLYLHSLIRCLDGPVVAEDEGVSGSMVGGGIVRIDFGAMSGAGAEDGRLLVRRAGRADDILHTLGK